MDNFDSQNLAEEGYLLARQVERSRTFFLRLEGPWPERVSVVFGGWEKCRPDYVVVRARYPYPVVELVVAGRGWVELDGVGHRLESGVCFASGSGTRTEIRTEAERPLEKFFFALAGEEVLRALVCAGLLHGRARRVFALGGLRELAEDILREGRRQGAASEAICGRLMEVFLLRIGEEPARVASLGSGGEGARENFERCRALIDRHAGEWNSLADIAAAAGLDGSSVCRLFRRFLGVTPHQYLRRRKMALAAAFLLETGGRVQEAAAYVGMQDPFHFSRTFKAVHGVPPSALLRARR